MSQRCGHPHRPCRLVGAGRIAALACLTLAAAWLLTAGRALAAEFKIGALANRDDAICREQWGPTVDYLRTALPGHSFSLVPLPFDRIIAAVAASEVDFIILNPSFYIELETRFGTTRLASSRNNILGKETSSYGGVVFFKAGRSDIQQLTDLRGKRFVAADAYSLGGWHAAWLELQKAGINPFKDFASMRFSGSHDAAVRAVLDGLADAGTVRTDTLERMQAEGKIDLSLLRTLPCPEAEPACGVFPFLLSTRLYPEWPLAKLAHVPDDAAREVAAALLTMPLHPAREAGETTRAWNVPAGYEPVRDLLRALRLPPFQDYGRITVADVFRNYWPIIVLIAVSGAGGLLTLIVVSVLNVKLKKSRQELQRELDARAAAEKRIREREARIRSLLNATTDSVFLLDRAGVILDLNEVAAKRRNLSPAELAGKILYDTLPPQAADARRAAVEAVLRTGEAAFGEEERHGRFYNLRIWPIFDDHGEVAQLASYSRDVTDYKLSEQSARENEEKYRTVADFTYDWEYWLGPDGRYRFVSPACKEITGHEAAEFFEDPELLHRLLHPEDRGKMLDHLKQAIAGAGQECEMDFRIVRPDGEIRWIAHKCRPIRRDDGTFLGQRGSNRDITARKQIEAEVADLKNLMQNIFDSMPSILVGVDGQGRVTHWNSPAAAAAGMPFSQAKDRPVGDVLPLIRDECVNIDAAIRDLRVYKVTKRIMNEGSEAAHQEITIYPLAGGGASGAVIRIDDVTERARLEEMMIQSEKMMSIGGLAAGMAHEINNPLGIILQAAQNAMRRISPALVSNLQTASDLGVDFAHVTAYLERRKITEYLADINEAGLRASKIVQSMLNFSRRSQSRRALHGLAALLDKTVELARSDYDLKKNYDIKKIKIVTDYDPGDPKGYFVETEIEQVFLNIIKNAAQAMAAKTYPPPEEPTVTLRTRRDGERVLIDVEDNGPGMDEATGKRVLEPFFTTKATGRGTGLGLSVTYFIVTNNYGGEIHIASEPGRGARFRVVLPLGKAGDAI
ncbi:MAG: PhnD/SsuA/transferrin family substrate-binding protein [Desulfovibrionaceae bacterium]|nr:PhnD/SsuA/transferrin family substrate-binding protein [Desulfovibrionaceae bacterium]MBF0513469.1 PhnD/SsuA/transferrin family substrate-binding protein [Desulfovibrionaceae bacterium]